MPPTSLLSFALTLFPVQPKFRNWLSSTETHSNVCMQARSRVEIFEHESEAMRHNFASLSNRDHCKIFYR